MDNFPNGITVSGVQLPSSGIPTTTGKVIWVDYDNGNDSYSGKSKNRAVKTVAQAYSLARSGYNDVIVLSANSSHVLSSMLTVAKNRVHFIGLDGGGRRYGQRTKLSLGVTTAATDLGVILNTGVGNSFRNIKFTSANTKAESLYGVLEAGEYALYANCEFYKETDLDETGAAELVLNGDSAQFVNCTFGSSANVISGTIIRPNVLLTKEVAGAGKVMRDCSFKDCIFWRQSSHANNRFVYSAADADVERLLLFENCLFYNAANSAGTPAQAIGGAASFTVGTIVVRNCTAVKCTKLSTTTGVIVDGFAPNSGAGIAVNAA